MPIEAPRPKNPDLPTPLERIGRFNYETQFVSSMYGLRQHPDFQSIKDMGEDAIFPIVKALEEQPSWIALALDEISGQNATGLVRESTRIRGISLLEIRDNSIRWAERESHIEIRSKLKRARIGQELFTLLKDATLDNPEVQRKMAVSFYARPVLNQDRYEPETRTITFEFNGAPYQLYYEKGRDGRYISDILSIWRLDGTIQDPVIDVELEKESGQVTRAEWGSPDALRSTFAAAKGFRQTVEQIFGLQTTTAEPHKIR